MPSPYTSTHSESLLFIGAGATARLGMPPTNDQTKILRSLSDDARQDEAHVILKRYFAEKDLAKVTAFFKFLDGSGESHFLLLTWNMQGQYLESPVTASVCKSEFWSFAASMTGTP